MTSLNNRTKINKPKLRVDVVLVLVRAKPLEEALKVKNQDLEKLLKVLKVVKCHFIEDYQKEVLTLLIE